MRAGPQPNYGFRSILVAIDSSSPARQALADAASLALTHNSRLTVMTVVPKPPALVLGYTAPVYMEDPWDRIERECAALLDRSVDALPAPLPVTKLLKHGPPARTIVREALENEHD